ncbi:hypothetical protein [Bacillus cereus group sp. Bce015]
MNIHSARKEFVKGRLEEIKQLTKEELLAKVNEAKDSQEKNEK